MFLIFLRYIVIIRKIKEFTNLIALHVKGEPLLHPDFNQILRMCLKISVSLV